MASLVIGAVVNIAVGLLINALFPSKSGQHVEGPRLGDLTVTTATYGNMIPVNYGTVRVAGNVIWAPPIEEVAHTETQESGKGGGQSASQTTYTYFATFAIAFGEGPADDVLRVWGDGKLIYDKTTPSSNLSGISLRFYPGDETQLPDSIIEAHEGAGNVPAHRGMCYVVFDRLPLANFGNRIPNITAEISYNSTPFTATQFLDRVGTTITGASFLTLDPTTDQFHTMSAGFGNYSSSAMALQKFGGVGHSGLSNVSACYCMNGKFYVGNDSSNTTSFLEIDAATLTLTGEELGRSGIFGSWGEWGVFSNGAAIACLPTSGGDLFVINGRSIGVFQNGGFVLYWRDPVTGFRYQDSTYAFAAREGGSGNGGPLIQDFQNRRVFSVQDGTDSFSVWEISGTLFGLGALGPADQSLTTAPGITVRKVGTYSKPGDLTSQGNDDVLGRAGGDCYLPNENALILSDGDSMCKISLDTGEVLARNPDLGFVGSHVWSTDGRLVFPGTIVTSSQTRLFWMISTEDLTAIASQVVSASSFPNVDSGWFGGNTFPWGYDPRDGGCIVLYDGASSIEFVKVFIGRATGAGVTLASVVGDLCERAHLEAADYDVTELVDEIVEGYTVAQQGPVRGAVEPLMRAYLFEGVESDFKVKFVRRGGASALTVPEADLGLLKTDGSEPVKETRVQEVELPERFTVKYLDRDRDYATGSQYDKRVALPNPTQSSRSELTLELPLVAKAEPMKQLAQRWLYTSWAERASIESTVGWRYARLDPTDVFSVSYRGELLRLRMSTADLGADLSVSFAATQEDAESDTSGLPADGGAGYIPQVVPSLYPTKFIPLDLPLLRDADAASDTFFRGYWAASGYTESWPGCVLMQSRDEGTSYQALGGQSTASTWGVVSGTLPDPGSVTTWDESAVVTLIVQGGIDALASATELEVLNGANAIAVARADGTCEVFQFLNVEVTGANTVQVSRLLRGRRGTEELAVGHGSTETWVLLGAGATSRFVLPLTLKGVAVEYRAVTNGTLLEDAVPIDRAFTAQDLLPYSVSHVKASLGGSAINLSWTRRTRIGGELRDGSGEVPLSEASEAYEVDVLDGAGGSVTDTLETATPSVSIPLSIPPTALLVSADTNANDSSSNAATATVGAQAAVQTVDKKFGAGAIEFSPSSYSSTTSVVSYPDIAAYAIGTGAFTMECWVKLKGSALGASGEVLISQFSSATNQRGFYLQLNRGTGALAFTWTPAGTATFIGFSGTVPGSVYPSDWFHIAATRDASGVGRLFINGQMISETPAVGDNIFNSTQPLRLGAFVDGASPTRPLNGFMDDVRIVVGAALYLGDFTPPASALTANAAPSSVTVKIFQMSDAVGRGRATELTLPL